MVNMLVKCEAKSNRVKGLAFHPTLPWILSALHNGTIQLWDYQLGTLLDKFEEHEGPVRGMSFHPNQPLFVSGGDDYKVKVWNYKLKRCLFTLMGHLDYIRTTMFHHEYPWILSASDDQTIRIWNWQSRQCIAVLTGHNHYVMSASFHPKDDLVVSASLDQTIRVWDVSGLKAKTVASHSRPPTAGQTASADLFGVNDAVVKFVLEGHDRGVNWAEFHPTQPLIVSASDDRTVKLWRMNESKAWEIDTLRGHFNNVSSCTFHPKQDLIISDGEDRTIRVWDASKRQLLHTFRREHDRFWVLACSPNSNLIAAGHDSGMVVFKLDRERPLSASAPGATSTCNYVYVVKNRMLTAVNTTVSADQQTNIVIGSCRKQENAMSTGFRALHVNPFNSTEMNVIITYDSEDGGWYDLFTGANQAVLKPSETPSVQAKQGQGSSLVFIARNRFAVLSKDGQSISTYSLHNELSKAIELPFAAEAVFSGGASNRVILRYEDKAVLMDTLTKETIAELPVHGAIRQVVWSWDFMYCAFLLKHSVVIADANIKFIQSITETIRVKSGVWDESSQAFIYSTSSHLKYALPYPEEGGVIQACSKPMYISRVSGGFLTYVDRECAVSRIRLFTHEYQFKLALLQGKSDEVLDHLKKGRLVGSVTIGYLKKKGFPEVALHFVQDLETRFNLSLEFGHVTEAFEAAKELKKPAVWERLHAEALRLGHVDIAEKSAIARHDIEGLQFLYFLTGNVAKLAKLNQKVKNHMTRFNLGLLRGDAEERVAVLTDLGLDQLANRTRDTFNSSSSSSSSSSLVPRPPLNKAAGNWPMTTTMEQMFAAQWAGLEAAAKAAAQRLPVAASAAEEEDDHGAYHEAREEKPVVDAAAWGDSDLDAELENVQLPVTVPVGGAGDGKLSDVVAYGESRERQWLGRRRMVSDLVAAGEFAEALSVLQKRIALVNAGPLESLFLEIVLGSHACVPGLPFAPSVQVPIMAADNLTPAVLFSLDSLQRKLAEAKTQTGVGNSAEALAAARYVLHGLTLSLAASAEEENKLNDLLGEAQRYAHAMLVETTRRALSQDPSQKARELELAAYLCCTKIDPTHLLLVVGSAMNIAFRAKNFILASHFAKRIITGSWGSSDELVSATTMRARKVLAASEEKGTDEFKINFDPAWLNSVDSLKFCCGSLQPIHPSLLEQAVTCPHCKSVFHPEMAGSPCSICQLSAVGASALGLQFRPL